MSIEKYRQARALIEDVGGGDFEGAKPESLVAKAESALGVTFPPSFRCFLLEMGCGDINGLEVFGLVDENFENSTVPNSIWLTLKKRRTIGLDPAYIVIAEGGDGTFHGLDTRQVGPDREATVVLLSVNGKNSGKVADSFGEYLLEEVRRTL